jgi:Tol biopolymer transport system component
VTWLDVARDTGRLVFSTSSRLVHLERREFDLVFKEVEGEPETLWESSMGGVYGAPSPNGRWFAFTGRTPQEDLYVLDLQSGRLRRLTDDVHKDRVSSWSPDSGKIYFYSTRSGRYQIWSLNPDGSELTQVTDVSGRSVNNPMVSPDGSRLSVSSGDGSALIELAGVELPITAVEWLPPIDDELRFLGGNWSPDGRRLVGTAAREGERDGRGMWTYEIESGEYRRIAETSGVPFWFDDRTFVFADSKALKLLDIETGQSKVFDPVLSSRFDYWTFSSDRRWLYISRTETQGDVWMLDHE